MIRHPSPRPSFLLPFWALLLVIPALGIIAAIATRPPTAPASPYQYSLPLNLPGTTQRRQLIEQEIQIYKTQLKQAPKSGLTLAALASAYWKLGKATGETAWYLLAEQTAARSIASLPFSNDGAHLVLAQVAQARHDFKAAQSIAQKILKTHANSDAQALLVTCAIATGDLQTAEKTIQPLLKLSPTLSTLTLQALLEEAQGKPSAIETFKLALQMEEAGEMGNSAWVRVLLGRHYYLRGDFDQAETLYQEALRILPRYPLALLHLAGLETQRGRYPEAERLYDRVVAYSQQAANVYDHTILRGKARLKKLQNQSNEDLLNQAEALLRQETNPGHANGNFGHRRELAQLLLDRDRTNDRTNDRAEALNLMEAEFKLRQDPQTRSVYLRALRANQRLAEAQQLESSNPPHRALANDLILGLDAL